MQTILAEAVQPPLVLADIEADILADLALAVRERSPLAADFLLREIDRASTTSTAELPRDVVTMMSCVDFVDEGSGERHSVQLVYPKDADTDRHCISVLTPIGAALIGMRRGDAIDWADLRGTRRRLRIVGVAQPSRS
jgi:regulator of nucleoside diphosphate kinase